MTIQKPKRRWWQLRASAPSLLEQVSAARELHADVTGIKPGCWHMSSETLDTFHEAGHLVWFESHRFFILGIVVAINDAIPEGHFFLE